MSTLGFRTLAKLLIGEDACDAERLRDRMYVGSAKLRPPRAGDAVQVGDRQLPVVDPGWYPAGRKGPNRTRSRREAIEMCRWLAGYDVGWVEDFIHPERFDEYAAVRAESPVPVAAGE